MMRYMLIRANYYIASLRSCIKNGARSESTGSLHSHVDTTAFWRHAYTKAEEAQIILRARLAELELQDVRQSIEENSLPDKARSPKKRKRAPATAPPATNNKKQKKIMTVAATSTEEPYQHLFTMHREDIALSPANTMGETTSICETPRIDDLGDACLHYICALQHSLSTKAIAEEVCSKICLLAYSIRRLIRAASEPATEVSVGVPEHNGIETAARRKENIRQLNVQRNLMTKLVAVSRVFPQILRASNYLDETGAEKSLQQLAIYSIVQVLQALTKEICDAARAQAKEDLIQNARVDHHVKHKAKRATKIPSQTSSNDTDRASELCRILLSMLQSLSHTNPTHHQILDGFLFHFLTLIGETLKHAVFNKPTNYSNHPDDLPNNGDSNNNDVPTSPSDATVQPEASYLLHLLSHTLNLTAKFSQQPDTITSEALTLIRNIPSNLSSQARIKLQHTLLKAVFGKEGAEDFEPALKPATIPKDIGVMLDLRSRGEERGEKEEFVEGVWRLLGWDVLRGKTVWSDL
ncbi:MAG: hypothetical protein Q9164_000830 [Protoblastenia rupestris]